jgi:predicted RNA-binding protein YlqC (UPF0109 family)
MKSLLEFLIVKITGASKGTDFEVGELLEGNKLTLTVNANPTIIGLIIGKEGKTIKNIRKIVSVRAVLENKSVNIAVLEQQS